MRGEGSQEIAVSRQHRTQLRLEVAKGEEREREKENHFPILPRTVRTPKSTQYWQDGWPVLTRIPPRHRLITTAGHHQGENQNPLRQIEQIFRPKLRASQPALIPKFPPSTTITSRPSEWQIDHNQKGSGKPGRNENIRTMSHSWNAAPHSSPISLRRVSPGHHARGSPST